MLRSVAGIALLLIGCGASGTTWLGEQLSSEGGSASNADGGAGDAAAFFERYEAESAVNSLSYPIQYVDDDYVTCPPDGVVEGAECTSGGKAIRRILGRSPCQPPDDFSSDDCEDLGGGITFNEINVPADALYDVTWWYHCGENPLMPGHADGSGDIECGGLDYQTGEGTGCRSHVIHVNGSPVSSTIDGELALYFHFPCYVTPWTTLHGATTRLPLKMGANTIAIHAPAARTLNAADIDAMDVQGEGRGIAPPPLWPRLVTPVVSGY